MTYTPGAAIPGIPPNMSLLAAMSAGSCASQRAPDERGERLRGRSSST